MKNTAFPAHDLPEVAEAENYIMSLAKSDSRLNTFYREYLRHNLTRVAMNLVYLRNSLENTDRYLDVGSFGIEQAILKKELPGCEIRALSYEGGRVGVSDEGFFENGAADDVRCVTVEQVDVERAIYPYPDDYFDLVSCFETLEHLKFSPIPMMKQIKRVLKPNGKVILSTPNINSAFSFNRMFSAEPPQECPYFHPILEYGIVHAKEYTVTEVWALFHDLGFHDIQLATIDTRNPSRRERYVRYLVSFVAGVLDRVAPFGAGGLQTGEKHLVQARTGGPILSERPVKLIC